MGWARNTGTTRYSAACVKGGSILNQLSDLLCQQPPSWGADLPSRARQLPPAKGEL